MAETVPFAFVDVFTREPLTGNPLAVVDQAEALADATMQRIAREFNQSETTFILPARRAEADWRLRSFTPAGVEVFGAGHNALGAWWWLAESGRLALGASPATFRQELGDQLLPLQILVEAGRPAAVSMTQGTPRYGETLRDPRDLAAALGLETTDLIVDRLAPQVVSTGAPHLLVAARDRRAIERVRPQVNLGRVLQAAGAEGCYVFCLKPVDPSATAHARFFNPTVGIGEDPATGTAAGPLAFHLVKHGFAGGRTRVVVEQGHAVGRPSRIEVEVRGDEVVLLGTAVVAATGTLRL